MATRDIVPRADGEGQIGTTEKAWLSGHFKTLYTQKIENDSSGDTPDYVLSAYASWADAISSIGSTVARLIVDTDATVSADSTAPSTLMVKVYPGCIITVATTKTLTINGYFEAGLYQVFSCTGTGKVVFGRISVVNVYPEWWGAVGDDSTDCSAAINAAIQSLSTASSAYFGGTVALASMGVYRANSILFNFSSINFNGNGACIRNNGTSARALYIGVTPGTADNISIRNLRIDKGTGLTSIAQIGIFRSSTGLMENVTILDSDAQGLQLAGNVYGWLFKLVHSSNNASAGFHIYNSSGSLYNNANWFENCGGINNNIGVYLEGDNRENVISNCSFEGNTAEQIHDNGGVANKIVNNYMEQGSTGTPTHFLRLAGPATDTLISGNNFGQVASGSYCIYLENAVRASLRDNSGTGVTRGFIKIDSGCSQTLLDNNNAPSAGSAEGSYILNASASTRRITPLLQAAATISGAGQTITPDYRSGNVIKVTVTTNDDFTIAYPTNVICGDVITWYIYHNFTGDMGTITWETYRLAGSFTNPANGYKRFVTFYFDGTYWSELSRSDADIGE